MYFVAGGSISKLVSYCFIKMQWNLYNKTGEVLLKHRNLSWETTKFSGRFSLYHCLLKVLVQYTIVSSQYRRGNGDRIDTSTSNSFRYHLPVILCPYMIKNMDVESIKAKKWLKHRKKVYLSCRQLQAAPAKWSTSSTHHNSWGPFY